MQDNFEIPNYNDSIMLQKQIVKGHGDTGEGGHGHAEKMAVYPRSGTNVTAITTFPIISSALEVNGITISPSPCIAFLSTLITAVTK